MPRTYQTEFPDYPVADMPAIPAAWTDESWRNEACPRFHTAAGTSVFIDYADAAAREYPEMARFSTRGSREDAPDFSTDTWGEILIYVAALEACEAGQELPESTYERFREGRATRADAIALTAENDAAREVCPDLARHLADMLARNG